MKKIAFCITVVVSVVIFISSAYSEVITYRKHIKPLFDAKCIGCHGMDAAPEYHAFQEDKAKWISRGQGMRMDTYSHLIFYTAWPDTGSLMRRLDDGKGVKPGNMYQHLGSTEEERQRNLSLFKQWIGNWTLNRWKDISKEDMGGIKVNY